MRRAERKASGNYKTKITTAQVDADNVEELVALIRKVQPDVVLNLALPYQDLHIMDACLETGVHYVDTANYEPEDTAKLNTNGSGLTRSVMKKQESQLFWEAALILA